MDAPPLTLDELRRLNRLLEQGLALDGAERDAWLAALDGEDARLRPVVADLLARSGAADTTRTLDPPPHVARVAADALAAMRREHPGDLIGPWKLERLLAEGGMGAVWLAQRADGVLTRRAALKLPRSEWIDHGLAQRIGRERAILARLAHPSIAVLYDAGVTADGRPYLALEYVDGEPIDRWCRGRDLPSVLRLFVQVVRAVNYAHGQLVIHRDLKPANVLVTADGRPKLLDFGIAKIIEGDATAVGATALTRMSGRPMTLPYAAPEHVLGLPVTVASDVYALGVMLFELIAEARLYRATVPRELEEEILRGDLRRPSEVAADPTRARVLRGDLDAIVGTALRRAPAERYHGAAALADDIERYLEGHPVRARPDSRTYRLRKFVLRNRLPVTAGAAALVALGTGLGIALWQAGEAREQARRATALNSFVLSLIRQADPNATQQTRDADLALLQSIEQRIDSEFTGSARQLLQLRVTVGDAYRNRGEMAAARRVFQRAVADAEPYVPHDDLVLLTARVRAADIHLIIGYGASDELNRAIEVLQRKGREGAELLLDALLARHELSFYFGIPEFAPPERRYDAVNAAMEVALRHFGAGSRQHLRAVIASVPVVGSSSGPEEAIRLAGDALARARERGDQTVVSAEYALLESRQAALKCSLDRYAEGLPVLQRQIAAARAAHGPASPLLEEMANAMAECDRGPQHVMQAYEIAAARERPPSTTLMRRAIDAYGAALGSRDFATAERYYQAALDNSVSVPDIALRTSLLRYLRAGRLCQLSQQGNADEAVRQAGPMKAEFDAEFARRGRLTPDQGTFWICYSDAQRLGGRHAEAIDAARTFVERCEATGFSALTGRCRARGFGMQTLALLDAGRVAEARAALDRMHETGMDMRRDPRFWVAPGRVLLQEGRAIEALDSLRQAHDNWLRLQPESVYAAEALYWLGLAHLQAGDMRGKEMVERASETLTVSPAPLHRALAVPATR